MKIALLGKGKMGKEVARMAQTLNHTIVSKEDPELDVFIDFSNASKVKSHVNLALERKKPLVIGTTGWDEEVENIKKLCLQKKGAILFAPNFSIGVYLFFELLKKANTLFSKNQEYELAALEMHHREKKDTPSGTAIAINQIFEGKCPFTSIRKGHFPGIHTLTFDSTFDTITLTHTSKNREGFAKGAILAAEWLQNKEGWFTLDDFFGTRLV